MKHCRVEIIACPFVLFHKDRFFNVCCLFSQRFSAAYLLKLFLLPQRAHTTLFIRCGKPELTRWCLCNLYAGIHMSPDEVVGSRDSCCHSIADGNRHGQPWRLLPFHRRRDKETGRDSERERGWREREREKENEKERMSVNLYMSGYAHALLALMTSYIYARVWMSA